MGAGHVCLDREFDIAAAEFSVFGQTLSPANRP